MRNETPCEASFAFLFDDKTKVEDEEQLNKGLFC